LNPEIGKNLIASRYAYEPVMYNEYDLNFNNPTRQSIKYPSEELEKFLPDTSPEKFRQDQMVMTIIIFFLL
jgi:hypothetical protein